MTSLPPIELSAQGQTCEIVVQPGLLDSVGQLVRRKTKAPKVALVTDSTVGPLYAPRLEASLKSAGFTVITHTLPAGEKFKQLETLLPAYTTFLSANIDRGTPLLALGGGVTGDMAGMLAATLLRGLPFVQIPTTLMAMVDSSIGGKTGVNHPAGKNLIGAFHQPMLVLSDPELLKSLPRTEIANGLAECIKHDAIRDPAHFAQLPTLLPKALAHDIETLANLVHHNAAIKAAVVNEDPLEKGVRAHLNLGHTFAHAIELTTHHAIPHGSAVGLGLCAAAWLSTNLGLLSEKERQAVVSTVTAAELPTHGLTANLDEMISAMQRDKKVEHGLLRFVLLEKLGKPLVKPDVPPSAVREAFGTIA